jgi:hypothetical protein
MPPVGTEEPIAVESDRHHLYILTLLSCISYLTSQVMTETPPISCFTIRCIITSDLTHHPIDSLSDLIYSNIHQLSCCLP